MKTNKENIALNWVINKIVKGRACIRTRTLRETGAELGVFYKEGQN
jgi:hypothetical protein